MIPDLRWFAPNRFCTLVVPALERRGIRVATDGNAAAGLVVGMDGQVAVTAWEYARRHACPLLLYLWDLPPWRLGAGRPDVIFSWRGRVRRVPRIVGRYPERAGYYSRIRYVARRADAVWAPSDHTQADLRSRLGVASEVIPYCYDSDRFHPVPWSAAVPPRLLSISRLVAHKNHAALLRAAARLDPRPVVRIIGQGPEAGALRRLAAELAVTLELETEWFSDDAIAEAYRSATVVVAPSRFEGFGLTPIEGIASGIPVVASDIPPHRQFLGDAATFFRLEDEMSLVVALRMALERGPASRDGIAALTIEAAAERFVAGLSRLPGRAP